MDNNIDLNKRWINQGTGEVMDGVTSIKNAETLQKEKNKRDGYKYYLENIVPLPSLLQEEYGNFIHTRYTALLEKLGNDTATAFRFIYLCTYMDYDSGYIIYNNNYIKKDYLIDIFNVSRNTMNKIRNTLFDNELIYTDSNGYICINTDYCYKGNITNNKLYKQQCTRIFNNSIKELYNKSNDHREHKMIGKFILLLPYINIWHNIICLNPKERDIPRLRLPNLEQLEKILGTTSRNSGRTLNELFEITVGGEKAILMVTDKRSVKMYVVNPRIYYGGTNIKELEETMGYFRAKGGIN